MSEKMPFEWKISLKIESFQTSRLMIRRQNGLRATSAVPDIACRLFIISFTESAFISCHSVQDYSVYDN